MKKCPFCDGEIQDDAIKCKHCREWLEKKKEPVLKKDVSNDKTPTSLHWSFTQMKVIGYFTKIIRALAAGVKAAGFGWIIAVLAFIVIFRCTEHMDQHPSSTANNELNQRTIEPLTEVSAYDLAREYDQNTVAADQKFKGKRFKVTGTVVDINTDFLGNPYLVLSGGVNQFSNPQFEFDKKLANRLANLRKGERVVLVCEGKGDIAKTPMSDSCIFSQ